MFLIMNSLPEPVSMLDHVADLLLFYFLPPMILTVFLESCIMLPFARKTMPDCNLFKKWLDVVLINCATNFFLSACLLFILYITKIKVAYGITALVLEIIIPFVEAKYYSYVWHLPYRKCLLISIIANLFSLSVSLFLSF